jgi:predicted metal-dependent hydrolase
MDDVAQGAGQSQDDSSLRQEQVPQQQERLFKQADVNDIVGRAKADAVESYKRKQAQAQQENQSYQAPKQQGNYDEDSFRKLAAEEAQRLRDEWIADADAKRQSEEANRIVQQFWNKVNVGKTKFDDFEKTIGDIEYQRFPNTVQLLADHIDNADEVLYSFGKNRMKMAQIEQLSYMSPKDAIIEIKRLSESIKDNAQASKVKSPNEPLSSLKSSSAGMDGGVLSFNDLKRKYRG